MAAEFQSFSPGRKWSMSLNVAVAILALLALVVMVNYLAARHFRRVALSARAQAPFSPLTRQVLAAVTNEVKVTIFFDQEEPLYDSVWALLKEYRFANPRILVESVDYERDAAAAVQVREKYKLTTPTAKNLVIFDCNRNLKIVEEKQLSDLDISGIATGQSREAKRTHFRGELEFTSAILSVTSGRTPKAYFLQGNGEHNPESDDGLMGYARFARVLQENNVQSERLTLVGTNEVPADCQLLIVAGPRNVLPEEVLGKIDRYLKQGGRLFALFNCHSLGKELGLERLLAAWGVEVGNNIVLDPDNSQKADQDFLVMHFADHPLTTPFYDLSLHVVLARSVAKSAVAAPAADAPQVTPLAFTGRNGRVITDVRPGPVFYKHPGDRIGAIPVMAAVEKGSIRGVSAERGITRMVVAGDSIMLGNLVIHSAANRDFASHAVNWLLARNEMLVGLAPQPIKEYRLTITQSQLVALRWLFLLGMPGSVLFVGFLVWMRRRN
jgi:hypothetical protein